LFEIIGKNQIDRI